MANQPLPKLKISEFHPAAGDTVVTNAKLLPLKNHLYLVAIFGDNNPPSFSLSGCGLTWVQEDIDSTAAAAETVKISVFRALSTTSVGLVEEALTATFAGQDQNNVVIQVLDINFVDTSGSSGSGAVIQSVVDTGVGAGTAHTITLAAFGDAVNNMALLIGAHHAVEDVTPEATWAELDDTPSDAWEHYIGYKIGEDTTMAGTLWSTAANHLGIAFEIKMRGATAMVLDIGQPSESDLAQTVVPYQPTTALTGLAETTRGGLVQRVGESLGLAYDVPGYEQTFLRSLWDRAIKDVLLRTHCRIEIGDLSLTSGTAEYRQDTQILAIDDGRGSTPAGIGHYQIIGLDEMIARQSANPVSDSYRKFISIQGDLMIVSPTPTTSETLRFYYVRKPTASSLDTNDFTNATYGGLPVHAADAVEYYMMWKAAEYDDKYAPLKPTDYMNLYIQTCGELKRNIRRMRDRRDPAGRIGYPSKRFAVPAKNSQYPR